MPSARRPAGARPEALFQPPPERQPLAARMRPRNLDEFVGQEHLVGERGPLRRSIARGHLSSLLLWGPPGTGKTSLARLLAAEIGAHFTTLSAVMSGVAEVRGDDRRGAGAARPSTAPGRVLFLDEIHRFNKAQQDALLPHVEDGTVTLIGATTENPYFEVNSALLSRMRVWRLEALTDEEVGAVVRRALDRRGARARRLARARTAASPSPTTPSSTSSRSPAATRARRSTSSRARPRSPSPRTSATTTGHVSPRLEDVEAAAQQRVLAYDRAGDGHYDTVSAFIKSLRGNDPDAALYWLAAMIAAGEDPKFIARRLIISASEDVGNADPRALSVAVAAGQALDWIGLPEAQYALAQATTYIATAPKSDSVGRAYGAAAGRRARARVAAGPDPPPQRRRPADEAARHRRRLQVPARLRGRRRRAAIPARRARRPPLLRPRRPGLRGDDRGPDGGTRRGARPRSRDARSASDPPMAGMTDALRPREENRKKLAETQKKDAAS